MSDNIDNERLQTYIKRLRDQARVEKNDVRHRHYVSYINEFVGHFGNEKVYLVGSTGEKLKLRWSKDYGDADFILCSGLFEVPVENLVHRTDTPCFVWVKTDGLKSKIKFDLIDGEYIPTDMLKKLSPELFTLLRGIYLIVTSTLDTIAGRKSRVTTTALSSRVGLARTEYRNLNISDDRITDPKRREPSYKRRRTERQQAIEEYKKDADIHPNDKDMMDLIINMITLAKTSESSGSGDGQFGNFAHVMHLLRKRRQLGSECTRVVSDGATEEDVTYVNDLDEDLPAGEKTGTAKRKRSPTIRHGSEESGSSITGIDGTYEEKATKDFVPGIKTKGILPAMTIWKDRSGFWPVPDDRNRIANCEIFVVSRYAPVSPDMEKDFCLSFNLAELELSRCMSDVQRDVFLILKSHLKGGFQKAQEKKNPTSDLKLKTYHVKTALYWVSEKEDPNLWHRQNIVKAVQKVLKFIADAAEKGRLEHYFIPENNLFAGIEKRDADLIKDIVRDAIADPVNYIQHFFNLDDGQLVSVTLAEDELDNLIEMQEDGGIQQNVDILEEAIVDFHKGFNGGPRDAQGNAPIINAIKTTFNEFFDDVESGELADLQDKRELEKLKSDVANILAALQLTQATNTTGLISSFVGNVLGSDAVQPADTQSSLEMESSRQGPSGGADGLSDTNQEPSGARQQTQPSTSHANEGRDLLAGAMDFFANSQNMDRASRREAEDELKNKAFSLFLGKPW